jgi:23S rRNA pseudouridine955/2504/2580 synthase
MLREGEVDKIYLAVVKGSWGRKETELRQSLHKYVNAQGERRVSVQDDGKTAVTKVKPLKIAEQASLLELRLMTGRTHQIRVHLAHAGHPVLGDDKYGDFDLNKLLWKQGLKRLLLHAARLSFQHPLEKQQLKFESKLPAQMDEFVRKTFK